jgi:hypothetical protein
MAAIVCREQVIIVNPAYQDNEDEQSATGKGPRGDKGLHHGIQNIV